MNQPLESLMGSIRRALRDEIFPELTSDHARSQLAGVLDVLGKIEGMVVWSPEVTREQLDLLQTCLARAAERMAAAGFEAPAGMADPIAAEPHAQATLGTAMAVTEQRFARLTDWLFAPPAGLPVPLHDELHALLRTTLRNTLKAQRRLVPSADFSSMTAPRPSDGARGDFS